MARALRLTEIAFGLEQLLSKFGNLYTGEVGRYNTSPAGLDNSLCDRDHQNQRRTRRCHGGGDEAAKDVIQTMHLLN